MKVLTIDDPVSETRSRRSMLRYEILERIEARFSKHGFEYLIGEILRAQEFVIKITEPGPDGGVDILAAMGPYGFDPPHLCVQVKSSKNPADVTTLRALQGSMKSFNATHGLLVCWGGFTKALLKEARLDFFHLRLWDADDVVEHFCKNYDRLPKDIRDKVPIEQVWILLPNEKE